MASGWVYTESDNPNAGGNSVLALHYGSSGALDPVNIREYLTKGMGNKFIPGYKTGGGAAVGTFDADQQVQLSTDHKFLFAANQGSNTIAVFKVNQKTGALKTVKGSPFSSDGVAPISIGYSSGKIVVANHGQVSPLNLGAGQVPGPASFVSFKVLSSGKLKLISKVDQGPVGLTQAAFSPNGKHVFGTGFYSFKDIESINVSGSGGVSNAPGDPFVFPQSVYAGTTLPFFLPPPLLTEAFGVGVNPSPAKPYIYVVAPAPARVAVYKYASNGALTFVGQANNPGGLIACWAIASKDGKHLYTGNSVSQDISLFDISKDGKTLTFVNRAPMPSTGSTQELALDPTGKFLYAMGAHDDSDGPRLQGVDFQNMTTSDAPADGNFVEAYRVGAGGTLSHLSTTALPVPFSFSPYGLAVLKTS